jgi:glutathione S-transferase
MGAAVPGRGPIFHLALRDEWNEAVDRGEPYRRSTLGVSLAQEGFIHCSFGNQVGMIADLFYRGRDDVLLLVIDPARVASPIRVEPAEGGGHFFPHLYGPLPVAAVVSAIPLPLDADGRLGVTGSLAAWWTSSK